MSNTTLLDAVIPAAGIGARMQADRPKQYLILNGLTILEHTIHRLLSHPQIASIIVALHPEDHFFAQLPVSNHPRIQTVTGGDERADSVLAGLMAVTSDHVLVHDAARPCLTQDELSRLIEQGLSHPDGAILATPVRDTMKRSNENNEIIATVCRQHLWHAQTPQLFATERLKMAIIRAKAQGEPVTDEASAMELTGAKPLMVTGLSSNIKITSPDDLMLAEAFLQQQMSNKTK